MNNNNNSGYPFTLTQWQELEQQALIYKHMASGIPIPPELLIPIQRTTTSFFPTSHHHPFTHPTTLGWSFPQLGVAGRRAEDPEPGRCRRTDGKKWRCSKEAYPDSKYCERHMHRGKNRSRKPVEISLSSTNTTNNNNSNNPSSSSSSHYPYSLMYPHPYQTHNSYLAERGNSWELRPLGLGEPKQRREEEEENNNNKHCFVLGADFKLEKPVKERDFFDEWPQKNKGGGSWMGLEGDESSTQGSKTTQLSISIPMGLHDFLQWY